MIEKSPLKRLRQPDGRTHSGSTMLLVLCCMVILLPAMAFLSLMVRDSVSIEHLESTTDSCALDLACVLNKGDREGQMNQLVAHSRQLVFHTRGLDQQAQDRCAFLKPLSQALLAESRSGAMAVQDQRAKLTCTIIADLQVEGKKYAGQLGLRRVSVGYLPSASNVPDKGFLSGLLAWDRDNKWITKGTYRSQVDLKLPAPDDDLRFVLSAMPQQCHNAALIKRADQRADLMIFRNGQPTSVACNLLPSTVIVERTMQLDHDHKITTSAAAATFGPTNSESCTDLQVANTGRQ